MIVVKFYFFVKLFRKPMSGKWRIEEWKMEKEKTSLANMPMAMKLFQMPMFQCAPFPAIFAAAGLTRPAPAELPQDRKVARVGGCSGAM